MYAACAPRCPPIPARGVTCGRRLNEKYKALLEKQRKYFKSVKEFQARRAAQRSAHHHACFAARAQEECIRNEKLTEAAER